MPIGTNESSGWVVFQRLGNTYQIPIDVCVEQSLDNIRHIDISAFITITHDHMENNMIRDKEAVTAHEGSYLKSKKSNSPTPQIRNAPQRKNYSKA